MRTTTALLLLLVSGHVFGQELPKPFGEALVVRPAGPAQRAVVSEDAIAGMWVRGEWRAPHAGESAPASTRTWEAVSVGAEGQVKLGNGGYAYVPFEAEADGIAMLQVVKAAGFYVNGEPRVGDFYGLGTTRLPVRFHKGTNELLVRGARDEVRLAWSVPPMPVFIDDVDATLPDLVEGAQGRLCGAVLVVNATDAWEDSWYIAAGFGELESQVRSAVVSLPPLSRTKVPFEFNTPVMSAGSKPTLSIGLSTAVFPNAPLTHRREFELRVRKGSESRKVTFKSGIDDSVQYYALRESLPGGADKPGMIFTLHGASVEALGQADAYASKDWAHLVAPTNRRPYGFDWEDWGRLDFLEVYQDAVRRYPHDPTRVYLTGHSMGGHGTWQIGAQFPGLFAAIAPSAGWISFRSYTGAAAYDGGTAIQDVLRRATSPSDTLGLKDNYRDLGIYVLHGDADDNVPVAQARQMRKVLGEFHRDFAYYERPGAGHWWGNECVDWPPLMEFLRRHQLAERTRQTRTSFTTMAPSVSGSPSGWATVEAQLEPFKASTVDLSVDIKRRAFSGTTTNVARLTLGLSMFPFEDRGPFAVEIDGQKLETPRANDEVLRLARKGDRWETAAPGLYKSAARGGPFKDVFRNSVVLVVGTAGSEEENRVTLQKARLDAETFWYRGNASLEVILDRDYDEEACADRNLVLYGNRDTNSAWSRLLADSPVDVLRGRVRVGDRELPGEDLACLFIRPKSGSETNCIGAVGGTGPIGMRLANRVPYFQSGVGIPDWIVLGPEVCERGVEGVRATGYFGVDWSLSTTDSAWRDEPGSPGP